MTRRPGRRPGDQDTRTVILTAARTAFSDLGFDGATIRHIAAGAGVDPALIHHYFGSKADLYATAIRAPFTPSELIASIVAGGVDGMGRRLAETFFGIWEDPVSREPMLAMLRGAVTGNETATRAFREFLNQGLVAMLEPELTGGRRRERIEMALAHLVGIAVVRYVVGVEPLASLPAEDLIEMVSPRLQGYLTSPGS